MRNCLDSGLSRKTLLIGALVEIVYKVLCFEAKYFQYFLKNGFGNYAILNHKYMIKKPWLSVPLQENLESINFLLCF